jgi:RimJ/RimL family protein N-acetyltransferase
MQREEEGHGERCPTRHASRDRSAMMQQEPAQPIGLQVDPRPARRPVHARLDGRLVAVTAIDPVAHEQCLYEGTHGLGSDSLWLYLAEGPFPDRASFAAYLQKLAGSADPLSFAIIDKATGHAVGHASYMRITPEHRVIEVGNIFYTPMLARSAAATEAMYLMARHAFEDLGYRRYEWKCNALNEPSRRAALRLGFSFEGIFRQHMIQKGRSRDTAWYAMLDREWPERKARLERWLSPENFDALGRQRSRLSSMMRDE